jgi:hypothetical protein
MRSMLPLLALPCRRVPLAATWHTPCPAWGRPAQRSAAPMPHAALSLADGRRARTCSHPSHTALEGQRMHATKGGTQHCSEARRPAAALAGPAHQRVRPLPPRPAQSCFLVPLHFSPRLAAHLLPAATHLLAPPLSAATQARPGSGAPPAAQFAASHVGARRDSIGHAALPPPFPSTRRRLHRPCCQSGRHPSHPRRSNLGGGCLAHTPSHTRTGAAPRRRAHACRDQPFQGTVALHAADGCARTCAGSARSQRAPHGGRRRRPPQRPPCAGPSDGRRNSQIYFSTRVHPPYQTW